MYVLIIKTMLTYTMIGAISEAHRALQTDNLSEHDAQDSGNGSHQQNMNCAVFIM